MARPREDEGRRAESQAERAKWAWGKVSAVPADEEEYLREVRKLPARLLTSGLGQTMAYLHAKAKGGRGKADGKGSEGKGITRLYVQLTERVRARDDGRHAMEIIVNLDAREYRRLGREVLETAQWLKRFAEGHIVAGKDRQDRGESK